MIDTSMILSLSIPEVVEIKRRIIQDRKYNVPSFFYSYIDDDFIIDTITLDDRSDERDAFIREYQKNKGFHSYKNLIVTLLESNLLEDLHLFDLKTLLEDVDRFSELSSPELHYFCLVDNMVLCIMKHNLHYRLWACHWKPSTFFCEDGRPVYPVYYPKGDKWLCLRPIQNFYCCRSHARGADTKV